VCVLSLIIANVDYMWWMGNGVRTCIQTRVMCDSVWCVNKQEVMCNVKKISACNGTCDTNMNK